MDFLGPFPTSSSEKRWIIVATDYLTCYAEAAALLSGTALEVPKFFVLQIVLRHGAPRVVITGRGAAFLLSLYSIFLSTVTQVTAGRHPTIPKRTD